MAEVQCEQERGGIPYAVLLTADMKSSGMEPASEKLNVLSNERKLPMTRLTKARETPDATAATSAMLSSA